MLESIVFLVALGADQLVKFWSMRVLANAPGQSIEVIPNFFWLTYAENHADNVSFLRGRSGIMNVVRVLQAALVIYLILRHREKLKPITRIALALFLAGLVGNQVNYITMDFVPDMFVLKPISGYVFNLADVFVILSMAILVIRLAFFEGNDFINWVMGKFDKKESEEKIQAGHLGDGDDEDRQPRKQADDDD